MRLLGNKIAVEQELSSGVSPGGIALPETSRTKLNRGRVRVVGPRVEHVSEGDYVLFSNFAGAELVRLQPRCPGPTKQTVEFIIIEDGDVIAILEEGEVTQDGNT